MKYNFKEIETKWQKYWVQNNTFKAKNSSTKPKYYILDMFPYPSGAGLHVGHPLGYIASDIYARYKRHKGFNVLHPQGYDSFGLPAEQYAIETGQHPAITTEINIKTYRRQLDQMGFSLDWNREVRTSSPDYYKWTQWIFIQLFESWYDRLENKAKPISELIGLFLNDGNKSINAVCDEDVELFSARDWKLFSKIKQNDILLKYRLTYLAESEVNWCPKMGTVLANDEIINGVSERGGYPVVRKKMTQWSMRISAYADRLLSGLENIDWSDAIKESQRNWIGKSVGALVTFNIKGHNASIEVFTTRPDTIFGVSFLTLAPEHPLVEIITIESQKAAVAAYVLATSRRSERERMADVKMITGVFTGAYVEHPFTKQLIPIWIGDYVLSGYGTGAVMSVPCGDQRDYDFAKHFKIPIPNIFKNVDISESAFTNKLKTIIVNSDFLNELDFKSATKSVIEALEDLGQGVRKINYRLRDAVFSRQRYWGEPFPVYYVEGMPRMIALEHLPITLPEVEKYLPTEAGDPPLGRAEVWAWDTQKNLVVNNSEINHKTVFPLELNTMPGWAGSSWYFNRYMDSKNSEEFASQKALNYWEQVDLYVGGSEHATGHLLYARFWQKFLYDRGYLPVDEFAKKLINQGMILGTSAFAARIEGTNTFISLDQIKDEKVQFIHVNVTFINSSDEMDVSAFKAWRKEFDSAEFKYSDDGGFKVKREVEKMSKSKYNVVSPDTICEDYGADALRLYEMFLGPLEQYKPWNTAGITGVFSFLKKLWRLYVNDSVIIVSEELPSKEALKTLHKTIKKVTEDIEQFSFNTSVSNFMIAVNELSAQKCTSRNILEPLLVLISPYAPHIAEELWSKLGHDGSISTVKFPIFESKYLVESTKNYPISFNGKMRFTLELPLNLSKEEIKRRVLGNKNTIDQLKGVTPKKVIVVPGKIVNIVG
ncbi:MAG: leucine--tRNA ligase [Flavobacteriaceae bacterium]|mgnify:CR=1 FL=1|nr:leucine--tRNA ligase [Flavobacteriaceae bacterium]|tara:strand:+ start:10755 stop:13571 length:2817 start_codon:yes stop_codon:yes gene_type:complete